MDRFARTSHFILFNQSIESPFVQQHNMLDIEQKTLCRGWYVMVDSDWRRKYQGENW